MPESKEIPIVRRLQGGILVPCNIRQVSRETEDGGSETFYIYDQVRLDRKTMPSLSESKAVVVGALNADLHMHIYSRYDQGTQATIQAYASKADRLGRTDIQDECQKIFDWIDSVLAYYDARKSEVVQAADMQAMAQVTWDFAGNVPAPADLMGWRDIRAMFSSQ